MYWFDNEVPSAYKMCQYADAYFNFMKSSNRIKDYRIDIIDGKVKVYVNPIYNIEHIDINFKMEGGK